MKSDKEKHACEDAKSLRIIERWSVSNGSESRHSWGLIWIQLLLFFASNLIITKYSRDQWNSQSNDRHLSPLLAQHCNQCLFIWRTRLPTLLSWPQTTASFQKNSLCQGQQALICKGLRIKNNKHRNFFFNYFCLCHLKKPQQLQTKAFG